MGGRLARKHPQRNSGVTTKVRQSLERITMTEEERANTTSYVRTLKPGTVMRANH
jgi:hypothetical protein